MEQNFAADPLPWPDTHLRRNVTTHWTATTVIGPLVGYEFPVLLSAINMYPVLGPQFRFSFGSHVVCREKKNAIINS